MKFLLVMASALVLGSCFAHATPISYVGGTSSNWNSTNTSIWSTGTVPTASDDVTFNSSSLNTQAETIAVTGTETAKSLTFASTGVVTINDGYSAPILLGAGGITINSGAGGSGIEYPNYIALASTQTWTNNGSSDLYLVNNVPDALVTTSETLTLVSSGAGSFDIHGVGGIEDNSATGTVALVIDLTGSGGITFESRSTTATNSGGTTILAGSVLTKATQGAGASSLGTGTLTLGDSNVDSVAVTLTTDNAQTFTGNVVVQAGTTGSITLVQNSGGGVTDLFSGTVALGNTLTMASNATGVISFTNSISGNGKIANVLGVLELSGANSYSGGTSISGGSIVVGSTSGLGAAGAALAMSGGTVDLATDTSVNAYNVTLTGNATIDSDRATAASAGITQTLGTLSIGANTLNIAAGANVSGGTPIVAFGATTLTTAATGGTTTFSPTTAGLTLTSVTGDATSTHTDTLALNGSAGTSAITGAIGNGSGGGNVAVAAGGTGTWTLSGANTYTGTTTITGGTLEFGNETALYNDNTAGSGWTAADLVVSSGATAAFAVGGTGQFSSSDLNTLLALGTSSGGFKSGSIIGLDTTGGNFSYGNAITNTNSNANTVGLTKLGANTLTLTGASTYTGTTTVNGGTLTLSDTTAKTLGGTAAVAVNSGGTLLFGTTDTINHSATVALGGGTLSVARTGSLNSTLGNAETMGALTLSARSTIDFGSGTSGDHNELIFSTFSAPGTVLTVSDWLAGSTYSQSSPSDTGSNDELLFGTGNGSYSLSTGQLADIQFYVNGSEYQAIQFNYNGYDEVAPGTVVVPEPSTVFAALCLLGLLGWRGRRRFQELVGRSMVTFQTSSFGYKGPHF